MHNIYQFQMHSNSNITKQCAVLGLLRKYVEAMDGAGAQDGGGGRSGQAAAPIAAIHHCAVTPAAKMLLVL